MEGWFWKAIGCLATIATAFLVAVAVVFIIAWLIMTFSPVLP